MASATVGILRVLLSANTAEFEAAMQKASTAMGAISKEFNTVGQNLTKIGASLTAAVTVPIVGMAAGAVKAAVDFETSFSNVAKTVDGVSDSTGKLTPKGEALSRVFREMAKEIPVTTDELTKIAALGGQMGVSADKLATFTRHVAALGVAVHGISTDEAAMGLAAIGNAAGVGTSKIAEMASTLVHLGNNSNATERGILELTQRLVGAGTSAGMTVPQIMALATTMSNVGIEAEKGGTAMSAVIQKIGVAVSTNSDKLKEFATVAGLSAQQFAETWRHSPVEAIQLVIEGLGRMKANGTDLNLTMIDLGLSGIRVSDVMKLTAGNTGDVAKTLAIANEGWQTANKHLEEAGKKYGTTANQIKLLWSQIKDLGIELGAALIPLLKAAVQAASSFLPVIESLVKVFVALPQPIQLVVIGLLGVAAAIGPLLVVVGQAAIGIGALTAAFSANGIAAGLAGPALTALRTLFMTLGPTIAAVAAGLGSLVLPIAAVVAAVGGLIVVWVKWGEDIKRIVVSVFQTVDEFFGGAFSALFNDVKTVLSEVMTTFGNLASIIQSAAILAFYELRNAVLSVWQSFTDNLGPILEAVKVSFTQITGIATNQVIPAIKGIALAIIGAIPGLQSLIVTVDWLRNHTPGWAKSTGDAAAVLKVLADNASGAGAAQKQAAHEAKFWADAQNETTGSINKTTTAATTGAAATVRHAVATREATSAANAHTREVEKQEQALSRLGIVTESSVNKALKELSAQEQLAVSAGADHNVVLAAMLPLLQQLYEKAVVSGAGVDQATAALQRAKIAARDLTEAYLKLIPTIPIEPLTQLPGVVVGVDSAFATNRQHAIDLEGAYKQLGITSQAELRKTAEESIRAYQIISQSGTATTAEIKAAFDKMQQDVRAASGEIPSFWETNVVPRLKSAYEDITKSLADNLARMLTGVQSFAEGFKGIWESIKQSLLNIFSSILHSFIDGFLKSMFSGAMKWAGETTTGVDGILSTGFQSMWGKIGGIFSGALKGIGGLMGSGFSSIISAVGGIFTGGFSSILGAMSGMLTSWIGIAIAAIAGLALLFRNAFRGGEEGTQVNPARNDFLGQFGGTGTGPGSGFYELGVQLEAAVGSAMAEQLHAALRAADTMAEFNAAVANINAALGGTYAAPSFDGPKTGVEAPEAVPGYHELLAMADGGFGRVTRPTLFLAGEEGPEDFAFSGANRSFAGSTPALPDVHIHFEGPVFAEGDYIETTVTQGVMNAIRTNRGSALTGFHAALGLTR